MPDINIQPNHVAEYGDENPDYGQEAPQRDTISAPQMIFALLNTKVIQIHCGAYHNVVVGTPRSSTAATNVSSNSYQGPSNRFGP